MPPPDAVKVIEVVVQVNTVPLATIFALGATIFCVIFKVVVALQLAALVTVRV